jgi:putative tryptophan/tyrosine transport system substrate-binding protein
MLGGTNRRAFIAGLGGSVAAQGSTPVVAFIDPGDSNGDAANAAAFRKGLNETGFVDGTNVTIEIHWLEGKFDRVSALTTELVGRQVAAIASTTPGSLAAKAATSKIPIVFASGGDPVKLGLVASLNRPGGNVTGVSFFASLMETKRLGLLHDMIPQSAVIAVLLNPTNPVIDTQAREVDDAAHALGLRLDVHRASTIAISTMPSPPSEKRKPGRCSLQETHFSTRSVKNSPPRRRVICSPRSPMGASFPKGAD